MKHQRFFGRSLGAGREEKTLIMNYELYEWKLCAGKFEVKFSFMNLGKFAAF